jgi:hypothetical protein
MRLHPKDPLREAEEASPEANRGLHRMRAGAAVSTRLAKRRITCSASESCAPGSRDRLVVVLMTFTEQATRPIPLHHSRQYHRAGIEESAHIGISKILHGSHRNVRPLVTGPDSITKASESREATRKRLGFDQTPTKNVVRSSLAHRKPPSHGSVGCHTPGQHLSHIMHPAVRAAIIRVTT